MHLRHNEQVDQWSLITRNLPKQADPFSRRQQQHIPGGFIITFSRYAPLPLRTNFSTSKRLFDLFGTLVKVLLWESWEESEIWCEKFSALLKLENVSFRKLCRCEYQHQLMKKSLILLLLRSPLLSHQNIAGWCEIYYHNIATIHGFDLCLILVITDYIL